MIPHPQGASSASTTRQNHDPPCQNNCCPPSLSHAGVVLLRQVKNILEELAQDLQPLDLQPLDLQSQSEFPPAPLRKETDELKDMTPEIFRAPLWRAISSPRRRRQGSIHSTYCRKSASQPAATSSWRAQVSFRPCQPSCHRNETRATTVHEYRAGVEDCIGAWLSCCKVRLPRLSPSNIATLRDSGGLKCDPVSSHFAECGGKIPLAFDDKLWWNYETRKAVVVDWVCYGCARLSFARFASRLSSSEAH